MPGPTYTHSASPMTASSREAITRTTRQILDQRRQQDADRAAATIGAARTSDQTPEAQARANQLKASTSLSPDLRLLDPTVMDELEKRVRSNRERAFLMEHPKTAGYFTRFDNAIAAQDDIETIGGFESAGNALARRTDSAFDGLVTGTASDIFQDLSRNAADAQLNLDELIALEKEKRLKARRETARSGEGPDVPMRDPLGNVIEKGPTKEEVELPLSAEMSAEAAGLWRFINSRTLGVSDERLQSIEKWAVEQTDKQLATRAFEASERAALWKTPWWRQAIEQDISAAEAENGWQGFVNILEIAGKNPARFSQYVMELGVESGVTLGAGVAVGWATKSPALAAITMGSTSYAVSKELYFDELMQEYDYDISSPEGRKAFLEDPEIMLKLRDKAQAYGIVVGLLDAASAGAASKVLVDNPVGDMFLQMFVQAVAGGSGEALGRLAAEEPIDWHEVILEAVAETVSAPLEVGGLALSGGRRKIRAVTEQRQRKRLFEVLAGRVQESALNKRDKEAFKGAISEVTENGPAENVHVDPSAVEEMFQSGDTTIEEFFNAIPELDYREFVEARDSGSLYVIPTGVYASRIAGTEIDTQLQEHLKLRPDDMSAAEAKTFAEDLAKTQVDLAENTEKLNTVIGDLEGPLAQEMERLRSEIVSATGFSPDVAERQAGLLVASARTGAERAGITVAEYVRRYSLPAVRNADTVGPAPAQTAVDPQVVLDLMHAEDEVTANTLPEMAEIRARLEENGVEPSIASLADVQAAVRQLAAEGRLTPPPLEEQVATSVDEEGEYMQTATLRGGEEDPADWGIDLSKKNKTRDIALKLQERQRKLYGKIPRKQRGPKTIEKMANWMVDELEFELQTPETAAVGWYGPKFQAALDTLAAVWGPLTDPNAAASSKVPGVSSVEDARAVATALFAVSSNGTKVVTNVDNALRILVELEKTGELQEQKHHRGIALNEHITTMLDLAREMGGVGMQEHLTRQMKMSAINKEIRAAGGKAKSGYPADMVVPYAARYLGPKLAAFYANLTGAEGYLTMDLWWTRSINRYRGDVLPRVSGLKNAVGPTGKPLGLHRFKLLIGRPDLTDRQALNYVTEYAETYAKKGFKNPTEAEAAANTIYKDAFVKLAEQPEGAADRAFMIEVAHAAQKELARRVGVTYSIADIQALLWYYEKRLYADMNVRDSGDLSYEEAATQVVSLHRRMHNQPPEAVELYQGPVNPANNLIKEGTILGPDDAPVHLYHGTNQEFERFANGRIFLTNQKSLATEHAIRSGLAGARVIEANVSLENPLEIEVPGDTSPDVHWLNNSLSIERRLREGGHDSVMLWNEEGELMVIATRDAQVTQINGLSDQFFQGAVPQTSSGPLPGLEKASPGRVEGVREVATEYMLSQGLPVRHQAEYVTVDKKRAAEIAKLYDAMEDAPNDPEVKAAYEALAAETLAQYAALQELGFTFEWITGDDPYASPKEAILDMQENKHLWVFPTSEGFGTETEASSDHPLLQPTGITIDGREAVVNDIFRIVHDVFGHGLEGASFGPRGEENAWQAHVRMFSPLAARAMTTETRGQNSWVNYGPKGEHNRLNPHDTVFADQKTGLLPEWVSEVGQAEDVPVERSAEAAAMLQDFQWDNLRDMSQEQLLTTFKRPGWYIVTATREELGPATSDENVRRAGELRQQLDDMGRDYIELEGTYKGTSDGAAFLVIGSRDEGFQVGAEYGQESILTNEGLVYTDGSEAENTPFSDVVVGWDAREQDFFSQIKGAPKRAAFALQLDFGKPKDVTVDDGDGSSHYGARVSDGQIRLTHWATQRHDVLDPAAAGTGALPGPERKRGGPPKVFFGMHIGRKGGYKRESSALGNMRHEVWVDAKDLYPWWQDPDGLKPKIDDKLVGDERVSRYEELIKEAGYKGYFVIDGPLGDAAVLFDAVKPDTVSEDNDARAKRSGEFLDWWVNSAIENSDGSPRMVFHATRAQANFTGFRAFSHFGTARAARQRLSHTETFAENQSQQMPGRRRERMYPGYLSIQNPLHLGPENDGMGQNWQTTTDMLAQVAETIDPDRAKGIWQDLLEVWRKQVRWTNTGVTDQGDSYETAYSAENLERDLSMGLLTADDLSPELLAEAEAALQEGINDVIAIIENEGYDGVIYENTVEDPGSESYVIFRPGQFKSVWNQGAWDFENADVLFQRAWHGSPHIFDRFSLNKLGTGEGAQAFGWGMYFAERRGIAEYYRDALAGRGQRINYLTQDGIPSFIATRSDIAFHTGELVDRMSDEDLAPLLEVMQKAVNGNAAANLEDPIQLTVRNARRGLEANLGAALNKAFDLEAMPDVVQIENAILAQVNQIGGLDRVDDATRDRVLEQVAGRAEFTADALEKLGVEFTAKSPGRLYEVHVPERSEVLNWEAPLSKQSPEVQGALQALVGAQPEIIHGSYSSSFHTALELLNSNLSEMSFWLHQTRSDEILARKEGDQVAAFAAEFNAKVKEPYINRAKQIAEQMSDHMEGAEAGTPIPDSIVQQVADYRDEVSLAEIKELDGGPFWRRGNPDYIVRMLTEFLERHEMAIEGAGDVDVSKMSMTGKAFYRELSDYLHGDEAASKILLEYGIPGHIFHDNTSRNQGDRDSSTFNYVIYDDAAVEIASYEQANNGSIILPKDASAQAIITMFESANLSTMLHETGHFFLWQLQRQASDGLTFAQEELDVVTKWWMQNSQAIADEAGVDRAQVEEYLTVATTGQGDVDKAIHRALHEQFARGFEAYLMKGQAPSHGLRSLFESFASWLLSWYKQIKSLNVNVSDDLAGVFDRMLATENEMISGESRNEMDSMIAETAREMGLDEDNYRRLVMLSQEARDEGRQVARKQMLDAERQIRSKEFKQRLSAIDAEERARVQGRPVQRAIQWLAYGRWLGDDTPDSLPLELRFDTELLIEEHGREILDKLPRGRRPVYAKDTLLSADEVAGWFGFNSGAELLDAMIKAPKANDEIQAAVNARAKEELGDIVNDPDQVAQTVDDALHGDKRGQLIVGELRAINRLGSRKKMTTKAQASMIAKDLIERMPVREALQTSRYLAGERKQAEQASRLLAAGDIDGAFDAKRKQLIQYSLYVESRKAAELTRKAENLAGRLKRRGTRENLAPEYLGAIDDILENYDFRKITGKAEVRRARLQAYVDAMTAAGRADELAIPAAVLNTAKRIPYKQLSVRRLRGVYDSLKNIEHTARFKQKLRIAQEERELQEVRDEIAQAFAENIKGKPINRVATRKDAIVSGMKGYFNLVRNADTLLRRIDGWASRGVMVRYFKQAIDEAGPRAKELRDDATSHMDQVFGVYTKEERRKMAVRQMWKGYDQAMSKWDVISVALNMGNKDNLERITSRDSKGALTKDQVAALVDNLDKRDWDFVQSIWDMLDNTYWPLIAAREERVTGVRPEKVDAQPVDTKFGQYRGGYYPIVYDRRFSKKTEEDQNRDLMIDMMAGRFGKAQTANGHTEARASGGGGRTVQLGMQVLFGHLNRVIHDLAYGEAVNQTWKLLQDTQIKAQFEDASMLEDHEALELWVQDVAAGPAGGTHVLAGTMRRMKSGFTLSKLAFNMSTVAIQVTGLTQSMALLGSGNMMKGVSAYLFSKNGRLEIAKQVKERSTFMQEREETFHRDAYDLINSVQLDPLRGQLGEVQKFMIDAGFFAMQKVQYYAVDVPTWLAAHQKGIAEGMTEQKAADYADRMVARAQASGLYADRTAVERGTMGRTARQNEFLRLFTALGSYMFAKYNVAEEVVGRTGKAVADPDQNSLWAIMKGATDLALLFTIEAIAYNLVKGTLPGMGDDDEDENWAAFLASETALSLASIFPFVRDVSSAVQGYSGGGAYGGISETFGRAISSTGDLVVGEATSGDLRSFNELVGLMVPGYPSTFMWRFIDGVGATGEEPSPLAVIMGR